MPCETAETTTELQFHTSQPTIKDQNRHVKLSKQSLVPDQSTILNQIGDNTLSSQLLLTSTNIASWSNINSEMASGNASIQQQCSGNSTSTPKPPVPPKLQVSFSPLQINEDMDISAITDVLKKLNNRICDIVGVDGVVTKHIQGFESKLNIHRQKLKVVGDKVDGALTDHEKVEIMADIIVRQDQKIHEP